MDCLSREQQLILQHNLTYEVYEQFMSMFNDNSEELPTDNDERNKYILDTMKSHEYWGETWGWGAGSVYKNLPKRKNMLMNDNGPHGIYDMFKGSTRKELLKFLEEFKKYIPSSFIPGECIPVVEVEEEFKQKPMVNRWMDDSVY